MTEAAATPALEHEASWLGTSDSQARCGSELQECSGLVAKVSGHVQVAGGHVEYQIVTELWSRIGDADGLGTPRQPSVAQGDEPRRLVGSSQQRYSSSLRLHEQVGRPLRVRFAVPKQPFLFNNEPWVKEQRVAELALYLNALLRAAQVMSAR